AGRRWWRSGEPPSGVSPPTAPPALPAPSRSCVRKSARRWASRAVRGSPTSRATRSSESIEIATPGDAAMATTPAVTTQRGLAAEYARLEERILARDQIAASQVLYGLLKQARPGTEIVGA